MKRNIIILILLLIAGVTLTTQARPIKSYKSCHNHVRYYKLLTCSHRIPYYYTSVPVYRNTIIIDKQEYPKIGSIVDELPQEGVEIIKSSKGIRYIYNQVIYKEIKINKTVKYKVIGFLN